MRSENKSVVILGAGIVGTCVALLLQDHGWRVTLLDPKAPGEGASKGNAGIIAVDHVTPVAMPGILRQVPHMLLQRKAPLSIRWRYLPRLAPWLYEFLRASRPGRLPAICDALASLMRDAYEAYLPLLDGCGGRDLIKRQGWLMVYESERMFAGARKEFDLKRERGVRVELMGASEIRQLAPAVSRHVRHGAFFPDCGHTINPHRLVRTLARAVEDRGGTIVLGEARDFAFDDGRVKAVIGTSGEIAADAVVVACGAWSRPLAARLGSRVPLDTERGYHVTFGAPEVELPFPIVSGDHRFGVTPMENGLRAAGTVEFGGLEAPPSPYRHELLVERTAGLLPGLHTGEQSRWMGFRPSMPDSLPVIGRAPACPNAYFAFGHGHIGITTGAVTARLLAQQMLGRPTDVDLAPFRADRFGKTGAR